MSELALPQAYSPEKHVEALENLVNKYDKDGEAVKYSDAAIDMDSSSCSSCLSFWADLDLIEPEKQGYYVPNQSTSDLINQFGEAKQRAKEKVVEKLQDDEIYETLEFIVENREFDLDKLAREVGSKVGVKEDNVNRLERYIEILVELEVLEINEEGKVTLPEEETTETQSSPVDAGSEEDKVIEREENPTKQASSSINIEIAMDVTDMDTDEIEEKLQKLQEHLN
ncbi:MAG: hypothetical protein ABEJ83_02615 [Candidatus Nanohaloarchaea archaeon]